MKLPASRAGLIAAHAVFAVTACVVGTPELSHADEAASDRISIATQNPRSSKRTITLEDMVSVREVHEPRQSPDGRNIAFLVKQAFLDCDCSRTAVYVVDAQGHGRPRKLLEEAYLSSVRWSSDGKSVSFLSSRSGSTQLWSVNVESRVSHQIFGHAPNGDKTSKRAAEGTGKDRSTKDRSTGVLLYEWAPNGGALAFTAEPLIRRDDKERAATSGFLFDDSTMTVEDVVVGDWVSDQRRAQLWLYIPAQNREKVLWEGLGNSHAGIGLLSWAPGGNSIAFTCADGQDSDAIYIVDIEDGHFHRVGGSAGRVWRLSWAPDGSALAVTTRQTWSPYSALKVIGVADGGVQELAGDITPGFTPWLPWNDDEHILFESAGIGRQRQYMGLYSISRSTGALRRLTSTKGKVSDCDVPSRGRVACVWQSPTNPPGPALIELRTGRVHVVSQPNPEIGAIELGTVREVTWRNTYGSETNGYLVLPANYELGKHLPLVIIGYGFDGDFVTYANETLNTYPAQAFARDSMAVLLFNYPRWDDWDDGNFARGSAALGYGPLSSLEAIVRQLADSGIVDATRVGMMGHSLAGFWTQFAIGHSTLFRAVELHNGGTFSEPGTYWFYGSAGSREVQDHLMGGGPYGATLGNYSSFSVTLNADKVRTPVLMEYDATEARLAMEYFVALREHHVPVDFFIYPNEAHVFERPRHRLVSMQRNLDWFKFWLLGEEDNAAAKMEQYVRWRSMRAPTSPEPGSNVVLTTDGH